MTGIWGYAWIALPDDSSHDRTTASPSSGFAPGSVTDDVSEFQRETEMENKNQKNILLCVAGMTPQIITETLYGLTQVQRVPIHEIRVITTIEGRNRILSSLLKPDGGILDQFCGDFGIARDSIRFDETYISLLRRPDGQLLDDVRTPAENEFAGDQICEIVRELCKVGENRIYASAAGGRKTMSIYLSLAMSLFGRAHDSLSHVLVSAEFENCPAFFYPRPKAEMISVFDTVSRETRRVSTESARVYIAPIPFIRFRGTDLAATGADQHTYLKLVNTAQRFLDKDERRLQLVIDLKNRAILVDEEPVKISAYELLLFVMFATFRLTNRGLDGKVLIDEITRADIEGAFRRIMSAEGEDAAINERLAGSEWGFLIDVVDLLNDNRERFAEQSRNEFMSSVIRAIGRLNKKLKPLPPKYRISAVGEKRPKRYGLEIPKEQIEIK